MSGVVIVVVDDMFFASKIRAVAEAVGVECLAGTLRHLSQGFVDPLAEATLERLTFDRAFLGADAVHPELGICEAELEQTRLKELMMQRGGTLYVLAHAEKLGRKPFHAWAPIPAGATLVTDGEATDDQVRPFEAASIAVVVVPDAPSVVDASGG